MSESSSLSASSAWTELSAELCQWFHDPDLEAFRIVLAALGAHYYHTEKPVWLLLIGDSGSGKTEIVASSVSTLPESWIIGDITPKSFLSAWQKGKENSMLFTQTVPLPGDRHAGIWIAKDFTTIFSLHHDDRAKVMSSLREIWDGRFSRKTGVGPMLDWTGKITLLALATPEVEASWSAFRGLGERFLGLRWRSPADRFAAMRKARAQLGHEAEIASRLRLLTQNLVNASNFSTVSTPDPDLMDSIDAMADVVSILRIHVPRSTENGRSILRVPDPEFPTRISMGLYQIIRTHAAMFGRTDPSAEDFSLAHRVAVDSVPWTRAKFLSVIPHSGDDVSLGDVLKRSGIPRTSLQREAENLLALRVIEEGTKSWSAEWALQDIHLSSGFRTRMGNARMRFQISHLSVVGEIHTH